MIESGDVPKRDIAYLMDRIAIRKGEPQVYGTQFDPSTHGRDYSPFPIIDAENVDLRRAEVGLESMADYRELMRRKYPRSMAR
jgi:hypothetical protein